MGRDIQAIKISGEDRRNYREKLRRSLDVFDRMLRESIFDTSLSLVGQEIELNLVDERGEPSMRNAAVLDAIANPAWATELGQFNIEINVPPRPLSGNALAALEDEIRADLDAADTKARGSGSRLVMIGILPTLRQDDVHEGTLSANARYRVMNEQIFAARGEDIRISIDGSEQLLTHADTLFEQATDTRPEELKQQGVRPRVWFGERWITSVFDLFEENIRYFPALLPICEDEDPLAALESGSCPRLDEMSLHNGTIYRWNRPVYAAVDGKPHLRVENRVLPAGPSVADTIANAAFYYGLVRSLAEAQRPIWTQMSFATAAENLHAAARHGIEAQLYWPGLGEAPAAELILRRLLPLAREGLRRWGVSPADADRLAAEGAHASRGADRREALRLMTQRYIDNMHTNQPVHTWPEGG